MDVIIYHNPDCGTSRNVLALIRNAGIEPHVIEYLKTPLSRGLPKGVRRCRPSETVLDLLPAQRGELFREDGEGVVDEHCRRVAAA